MDDTHRSNSSLLSARLVATTSLWFMSAIVQLISFAAPAMARSVPAVTLSAENLSPATGSAAFDPFLGQSADHLPRSAAPTVSHLVLKLSERTLYLYDNQTELRRFSVAVGRTNWETPTGQFTIFQMLEDPAWENPLTGQVVPPGGNNPLGQRWIGFWSDGTNAIGFHGTPHEESIGQAVSHGCVRLRNQDVMALYDLVAIGTPVYVMP